MAITNVTVFFIRSGSVCSLGSGVFSVLPLVGFGEAEGRFNFLVVAADGRLVAVRGDDDFVGVGQPVAQGLEVLASHVEVRRGLVRRVLSIESQRASPCAVLNAPAIGAGTRDQGRRLAPGPAQQVLDLAVRL